MTSARLQTRCFSPITGAAELGAAEVLGAWGAGARLMMSRAALAIRQVTGRMDEELDEALVARIAEGEERAFRTLVERHMQRSMRLAQRVLGNAADAEEVVQEAFLRLWTKADTWQPGRGRFTTWFFRTSSS